MMGVGDIARQGVCEHKERRNQRIAELFLPSDPSRQVRGAHRPRGDLRAGSQDLAPCRARVPVGLLPCCTRGTGCAYA